MSEIIKKVVDSQEFTFVNSYRSNRSGFVHETDVFHGERKIAHNRSQYYNRTWESYTYQSCMRQAVYQALEEQKALLIDTHKRVNKVTRMTAEAKAKLADNDATMQLYAKLLQSL